MHDKKPNIACCDHCLRDEDGRCIDVTAGGHSRLCDEGCAPVAQQEQPTCSCGKPERGRGPWHSPGRCAMYTGALDLPVPHPPEQPTPIPDDLPCRFCDEPGDDHRCEGCPKVSDTPKQPTCDEAMIAAGFDAKVSDTPQHSTTDPTPDERAHEETYSVGLRDGRSAERARIKAIIEEQLLAFDGCDHHSDYAVAEQMQRAVEMFTDTLAAAIDGGPTDA